MYKDFIVKALFSFASSNLEHGILKGMSLASPFPGMDPFLEEPSEWHGVHTRLIVVISDLINERLPSQFSARIEGNVAIMEQEVPIARMRPDLYLTHNSPLRGEQVAMPTIATPEIIDELDEITVEEQWLEIVDRRSRAVVTTIEILSPFNKMGQGYEAFLQRRKLGMGSSANWLEIDLLRGGKRPFSLYASPMPDYYALMKRAKGIDLYLWRMPLRQSLLTIGVPLTDGYADVALDLQAAVDVVYENGRYALDLDYNQPTPLPQLSQADEMWVREQIAVWRGEGAVG